MNDDTLLYRQINSSWLQKTGITSQAFKPTPKDKCRLSVYDGSMISAEDAWHHFTKQLTSVGVMGVTVAECRNQNLMVYSHPQEFHEHAIINFEYLSKKEIHQKAKNLSCDANTRSWCYRPSFI